MEPISASAIVPFINLDHHHRSIPLYKQIYEGYRSAIYGGRLQPGQRIPSTRVLARELDVSRLTVSTAFEQLLHEGLIVGRAGAGSFVTSSPPTDSGGLPLRSQRRGERSESSRPGDGIGSAIALCSAQLGPFRVGLPALDQFPQKTWGRIVSRHARRMTVDLMAYGDAAGHFSLRSAIANYLRTARAVRCATDQIIVVSGSQMALHLCARVLLKPGDEVFFEDPGYARARVALSVSGATVRAVPVDSEGLSVRSMTPRTHGARVVYVTPSHQYPLGMCMSAARRLELLDWAREHQAWILEDDCDNEFRFTGRSLAARGENGFERQGRRTMLAMHE
jgi:GntR family transcriptional regulator/MocR family aminotransferase